ncbi:M48 family metallopeptidase [Allosphingosinicella humi]
MAEAWLYDGESAVKRAVSVERGAKGEIVITGDGFEPFRPEDALLHIESRADAELYGLADTEGWRLCVPRPIDPEIAGLLPARRVYGRWIDRIGLGRALVAGGLVSAAILFVAHRAPTWLAPYVPQSWEQKFGDAMVGDFGGRYCAGPGGQEALDRLAARLTPDSRRLKIRVVDIPLVNAVALPGGNILVFRGLLDEAKGPDEVAGVLGHEIAHVANRDTTEAMIRHYGFSVLLASLGGTTGGNVEMLASASYSRAAESRADEGAIAALRRARISPLPTAAFFARLEKEEAMFGAKWDRGLAYVSSHPLSHDRRERFAASAETGRRYAPALGKQEWVALTNICGDDSGD